jgi:hypothetical protein
MRRTRFRCFLAICVVLLRPYNVPAQSASQPAEAAGLSIIVLPAQPTFLHGQPLVLSVSFRNVSSEAFALPGSMEHSKYVAPRGPMDSGFALGSWTISAEDVGTGKRHTGGFALPSGALEERPKLFTETLGPGESRTAAFDFRYFAFVEGDYDYKAAGNAIFRQGLRPPEPPDFRSQLPPGTYRIRLSIQFIRPDLPSNYRQALIASYQGSALLWQGPLLTAGPVQVQIE